MMIVEAKKLGFYVSVLDPQASCPASGMCDCFIQADFSDETEIRRLAQMSDVLTYELEHINADALIRLEKEGFKVFPSGNSLKLIQDKLKQKEVLSGAGIPVAAFMAADSRDELVKAANLFGYPLMVKSRFGGYDGRGNHALYGEDGIDEALSFSPSPKMAEQWVDFKMELSVLACRGYDGEVKVYPVAQNTHSNSILRQTRVPADIPGDMAHAAMGAAELSMSAFSGVGMFCIELFAAKDGRILVNEVAPRPHNSGHYTIEACRTSQFENHIRAVAGLPLGDPALLSCAAMENILGEGPKGRAKVSGIADALAVSGASVHIYGKEMNVSGRKMGHVTATGESVSEAAERAEKAARFIKVSAFGEGLGDD
jgi:5-(carboxyamino)imidazole ribonucleotide synthase